jgi:hypothetical protein
VTQLTILSIVSPLLESLLPTKKKEVMSEELKILCKGLMIVVLMLGEWGGSCKYLSKTKPLHFW